MVAVGARAMRPDATVLHQRLAANQQSRRFTKKGRGHHHPTHRQRPRKQCFLDMQFAPAVGRKETSPSYQKLPSRTAHGRICAGGGQEWPSLPRPTQPPAHFPGRGCKGEAHGEKHWRVIWFAFSARKTCDTIEQYGCMTIPHASCQFRLDSTRPGCGNFIFFPSTALKP